MGIPEKQFMEGVDADLEQAIDRDLEIAVGGIDRIFRNADLRLQWQAEQYRYDFDFSSDGVKQAVQHAVHTRQQAEKWLDEANTEVNPEATKRADDRWSSTLQRVIYIGWAMDKVVPRQDGEFWYDVIENTVLGRTEVEEKPEVQFNPEGFGELVTRLTKDAREFEEHIDAVSDFVRLQGRGNLYGIDRISPAKARIEFEEDQVNSKAIKRIIICKMLDATVPLTDNTHWFDEIERRGRSMAYTKAV